jgi:hypothetical protein
MTNLAVYKMVHLIGSVSLVPNLDYGMIILDL